MKLIRNSSYNQTLKKQETTYVDERETWYKEDFNTDKEIGRSFGLGNPNQLCHLIANHCLDLVNQLVTNKRMEVKCVILNQHLFVTYFVDELRNINNKEEIMKYLLLLRITSIEEIHEEVILSTFSNQSSKPVRCYGVASSQTVKCNKMANEIAHTLMKTYESIYLYVNPKLHNNVSIEVHFREGGFDERLQRGINEAGIIAPDFGKRFFGYYIQKVIVSSAYVTFDNAAERLKTIDELTFKLAEHLVAHYSRLTNYEFNTKYRYKANLHPLHDGTNKPYHFINFPLFEFYFKDQKYPNKERIQFGTNHILEDFNVQHLNTEANETFDTSKTIHDLSRLGTYYARWISKNVILNKLAKVCEVYLTFNQEGSFVETIELKCQPHQTIDEKRIKNQVLKHFSFEVNQMIKEMMRTPFRYLDTIEHSHTYSNQFPWESRVTFDSAEEVL